MSFLFGKKKSAHGTLAQQPREAPIPEKPNGVVPVTNGIKEKDKSLGAPQTSTPSSSVNNSLNSLGGANTPSPEHGHGARGGPDQDSQVSATSHDYLCLQNYPYSFSRLKKTHESTANSN